MPAIRRSTSLAVSLCTLIGLAAVTGCQTVPPPRVAAAAAPVPCAAPCAMPRELSKVVLPAYVIEPPDVLVIDAVYLVPRAPYRLRTMDIVHVHVAGTLPDAPISAVYPIGPGGLVQLGTAYGAVRIDGMTVDQAARAIEDHLRMFLKGPLVSVTLVDVATRQQVAGEHLVGPDGTVTLGCYGGVAVVGQTIAGAKCSIEAHLAQFFENPEVAVDVFAYNSKVYYIITQGAGLGDGVYRFPVTGNETVLDAISQINGMQEVSSKQVWVARPTGQPGQVQVLPVCWNAITAEGSAQTNYQVLPGDRIFIAEDKLVAFDTMVAKLAAPLERVLGFTLLGTGTTTRLSGPVLRGGGNPRTTF